MNKKWDVSGSLVALGFLLTLSPALNAETVHLQLKWEHQFQFAGYYAAQEQGYYKAVGLDVEILPSQPDENPIQQVIQGKAEFGVGTTDLLLLREQGAPVVALAVIFQHSPLALMELKQDGVQSIHDLVGSQITLEPGSAELQAYLNKEGISSDKFTLAPHQFDTKALLNGTVKAMSVYVTDEPFDLKRAQTDYLLYSPRAVGIDFYGDTLFTSEQQLNQAPETVVAFREASLKGWDYAMRHPEELAQLIHSRYSQRHSLEHLRFEAAQMAPLMQINLVQIGHMNPGRWRHIADTYAELGLMEPDFDLAGFLYNPHPPQPNLSHLYRIITITSTVALFILVLAIYIYQLNRRLRRDNRTITATQKSLRENEDRMALVLQGADLSAWDWNVFTGEVIYDKRWAAMLGYTLDEIEPNVESWKKLIHPDDLSSVMEVLNVHLEGTTDGYEMEHRMRHKSGRWVWIQGRGRVLERDADGKPLRMCGMYLDITDRKQVEEEKDRLIVAIDHAAETIVITDPTGAIQYANPAFESTTGYANAEAMGQNPRILKGGQQDDAFYRDMWQTLSRGEIWHGNFVNKRKDGSLYTEEATISPVFDAAGNIVNYVAVKRDITEHLELEAQFRQAQKMESIGRLAGGVAHDFNNALMGMMGYVELCRDKVGSDPTVLEYLDAITEGAERSATITRQLLAFARKQMVKPKVLDLNDAVAGMLKLLRRLISEDVEIKWSPGSGAMMVKIDPSQIDQILVKLAVNARDAIGGEGKLTIETGAVVIDETYCATHEGAIPGDYVSLTVSDSGCGMDKATMADVFDPFFTTKGVGEGTGMGLATVYGIVKQNNGFVYVYSEPGKGTTFKIYIPQLAVTGDAPALAVPQGSPLRGTETVLIAEDEKSIRITSKAFLKAFGYTVLTAENPAEALRLSAEHTGKIHLLLTDVIMPGMSGPDLAKQLAKTHPEIRILFMSGFTADVIAQRGILEKDMDFLSKPFGRDPLARKVREVLDRVGS